VPEEDDEAKPETAALLEELKSQLRKAETASNEYQKQLLVLQSRLDETMGEQIHLEEVTQNNLEKIEFLQNENKKALKQNREIERMQEIDKNASLREIENARERELELNGIVQRLKESLPYREPRKITDTNGTLSRTGKLPVLWLPFSLTDRLLIQQASVAGHHRVSRVDRLHHQY